MNQPVPVSRSGLSETRCSRPPPQLSVTSAATSVITRATAGLVRRSASCNDSSAAGRLIGVTRARRKTSHASMMCIGGLYRQKKAPEVALWSLGHPGLLPLLQDLDGGFGLCLGLCHVAGLARSLRLTDQLRGFAAARGLSVLAAKSALATRGLSVLATWSLGVLTARRLQVLLATRGLSVLATRRLSILTARRLHVLLATRGLSVLATRRLSLLATRRLGVLATRRLSVLATRRLSVLTARRLHVLLATRGLSVLTARRLCVLTTRGLSVLTARRLR